MPLIVNMQPAGKYLGERFHRAGGVPAVLSELLRAGKIDGERTHGHRSHARREHRGPTSPRIADVITSYDEARCRKRRASSCLKGNLFDFAIMKTSVISAGIPQALPRLDGDVFECRAVVFDGSTDYHDRINDPALGIDENTHARDPRLGPAGLAGLGRSREHAAARCADQARHHEPADAGRRPAVGHVGQPVDPQLLSGKRRRWRSRLAADRRPDPHRPRARARCDMLVAG